MISRLDSLHDVVIGLQPLVEDARRAGNGKPFQIFRNLQAEDDLHGDHQKALGDNMPVVKLVLESLNNPKAKAADAMGLLSMGRGTQSLEQRLESIEVLRKLLI